MMSDAIAQRLQFDETSMNEAPVILEFQWKDFAQVWNP